MKIQKSFALLLAFVLIISALQFNAFSEEECMHPEGYRPFARIEPTCADNGRIAHKRCKFFCGYITDMDGNQITEEDLIIPATGLHDYDENNCCTFCGFVKTHEHSGGKATCVSKAVCIECGEVYGEFDKGNHASSEVIRKNEASATCVTDGYTGDIYYLCCGELKEKGTAIAAVGHKVNIKTENEIAPTCGNNGSYDSVSFCTVCTAELSRETIAVPATGEHNYNIEVEGSETEANCSTEGSIIMRCQCSAEAVFKTGIDPEKHSWGDWTTVKNASCTDKGLMKRTCAHNKAHFETKEIPASGHSLEKHEANKATCTDRGNIEYYSCDICGKNYLDENGVSEASDITTEKLSHTFTEYIYDGNATCTKDGTETAFCSSCRTEKDTRVRMGSALGHSFTRYISDNNATCISDGTVTAFCDRCKTESDTKTEEGSKDFAPHKPDESGSKCLLCSKLLSEEHNWSSDVVVIKEAGCNEDGAEAIVCLDCGEIKVGTKVVIAATGHTYTEDWKVILPAGCEQMGVRVKICKKCLDVVSETLGATGHSDKDADRKCDLCGFIFPDEEVKPEDNEKPYAPSAPENPGNNGTENCSCACHSTGFSKFMFDILNFFYRLFGINRVCKCGASH